MESLAVRVLGDFGVDGVEPQAFGSKKARLALHLLALAGGQAVPASVLTDALWGDTPPAHPDDQLAVLMSRLRSVLGRDRIDHTDSGYLLKPDWLDAAELAALTAEVERRQAAGNVLGAVAAARVALSLVRGEGPQPLPGEWAQLRQAELVRLIGRSRQVAADALLAAGDWVSAVDAAAVAMAHDPYDETALRLLLRAYVLGGQVAAPGRRPGHRSLAGVGRAVHRDPARRAGCTQALADWLRLVQAGPGQGAGRAAGQPGGGLRGRAPAGGGEPAAGLAQLRAGLTPAGPAQRAARSAKQTCRPPGMCLPPGQFFVVTA